MVELETSGFTATRAEAIDVGATLAVALPHGAPNFTRHVSTALARVSFGDGTALARVSVADGFGRLRRCIVVVLARVSLSGGTALPREIRRLCMRVRTALARGCAGVIVTMTSGRTSVRRRNVHVNRALAARDSCGRLGRGAGFALLELGYERAHCAKVDFLDRAARRAVKQEVFGN
jgi:hypothetical protein